MGSRCSKFNCFPHANSVEKATPGSTEAQNQPENSVQNQNQNPVQNVEFQGGSRLKSSSAFVERNEAEAGLEKLARDLPEPQSSRKSEKSTQKPLKNPPKPKSDNDHERFLSREADYKYIRWEGFAKSKVQSGESCCICHLDLEASPLCSEAFKDGFSNILPEVAVLPCGHVFHATCLEFHTPVEQSRDPPCTICEA